LPAWFCGVVGLRPTPGLVPTWPSHFMWDGLQVTGPMGRTAEDVAMMLQAIAGPSRLSPVGRTARGRDFVGAVRDASAQGLRIAYCPDLAGIGVDADGDTITSCVIEYTDRKPAKTTTPTQRRAIEVLHNVLVDQGRRAPDTKHYPARVTVIDVGVWREYLEKAGVLDAQASNPRQPFKRLKEGMIDRGLIGEWDGLMWAVRDR
ncbi:MAG: hypothetical protein IIA27_16800, partial [Gemmatimonadetes bacterium]|nr:hypothetical protein [Gemmatimonadota bacterium]